MRCDLHASGRDAVEPGLIGPIARRPSQRASFDTGILTPLRMPARRPVESVNPSHFICRDGRTLPLYGKMKDAAQGLYLGLFHGRDDVGESMDGMGAPGPAIGPLVYARTAYAAHLYLRFADPAIAGQFFPEFLAEAEDGPLMEALDEIPVDLTGSTVPFDGRYFGDWTVFYHDASFSERGDESGA